MYRIAIKMLIEDKAKYIGLILSISFSTIIIMQQSGIFFGLMRRTYGAIADTPQADIWVMDPSVLMVDDIKPLRETDLYRVRSISGVAWAVPMYKGLIRAKLPDGTFQTCILVGVDDATLIGGPHTMLQGSLEMLRRPDAIIVNKVGAEDKLARTSQHGKLKIPLSPGDVLELNDRRAEVVGICDVSRTFQSQPFIYTTYKRAVAYAPLERKNLSFILAKADDNIDVRALCKKISQTTRLAAYPKSDFEQKTIDYYMENTGIPINFGIAVLLGLFLGAAIAGQIFYNFVADNIVYLALFCAMGASPQLLARMTMVQALWVAVIGWSIGSGAASMIGFLTRTTELSFYLPWQLYVGTGLLMLMICFVSSIIGIAKIYAIELATILKQ